MIVDLPAAKFVHIKVIKKSAESSISGNFQRYGEKRLLPSKKQVT